MVGKSSNGDLLYGRYMARRLLKYFISYSCDSIRYVHIQWIMNYKMMNYVPTISIKKTFTWACIAHLFINAIYFP
jgi:hypothetical protein